MWTTVLAQLSELNLPWQNWHLWSFGKPERKMQKKNKKTTVLEFIGIIQCFFLNWCSKLFYSQWQHNIPIKHATEKLHKYDLTGHQNGYTAHHSCWGLGLELSNPFEFYFWHIFSSFLPSWVMILQSHRKKPKVRECMKWQISYQSKREGHCHNKSSCLFGSDSCHFK